MEYTRLGPSGLKVSRIALGCMSFGTGEHAHGWALDDAAAAPVFRQARRARHHLLGHRQHLLAGHVGGGRRPGDQGVQPPRGRRAGDQGHLPDARRSGWLRPVAQGDHGADRRVAAAARHRLRRPLPDPPLRPATPVEETMEALHDVVKAGKARYLGASSMWAWQFATMQHAADLDGWTRFVSMQNQYSLLQREEEREMFGLLAHQGVGSIPWSPLAKGRLARPWPGGRADDPGRDRRAAAAVRRRGEPAHRGGRPAGRRGARRTDGPGRARLGAAQPGRDRPDRRADEGAPPHRRRRGPGHRRSPTTRSRRSRRRTRRGCRRASPEVRREIAPVLALVALTACSSAPAEPAAEPTPSPATSDESRALPRRGVA